MLDDLEEDEDEEDVQGDGDSDGIPAHEPMLSSPEELAGTASLPASPLRSNRGEDTVRRRKRFSMPAVAIHTTPVTARPNVIGEGKGKRWSLVLGNLKSSSSEFTHGVAAGKLNDLLGRQSRQM